MNPSSLGSIGNVNLVNLARLYTASRVATPTGRALPTDHVSLGETRPAGTPGFGNVGAFQLRKVQTRIDQVLGSFEPKPVAGADASPAVFHVDEIDDRVVRSSFNNMGIAEGDSVDLNLVTTASTQHAGLFLALNGPALDTGGLDHVFTIEVGGVLGTQQLSFASGTSFDVIATTINNFAEVTGTTASASPGGVTLISEGFTSGDFTSVRVIDDAGVEGAGIYQFDENDFGQLDDDSLVEWNSAQATVGVEDFGQDLEYAVEIRDSLSGQLLDLAQAQFDRISNSFEPERVRFSFRSEGLLNGNFVLPYTGSDADPIGLPEGLRIATLLGIPAPPAPTPNNASTPPLR